MCILYIVVNNVVKSVFLCGAGSPETSVSNHFTPCDNAEDGRIQTTLVFPSSNISILVPSDIRVKDEDV